jgi:DNA-binding XRE family transcriptional regulator
MRLRGRFYKSGKFWLGEIPLLDTMTQGRTRRELFEMVVDLVETLANRPEFSVQVFPGKNGEFEVSASDAQVLVGMVLRRQRERNGLSLADVAHRLGAKSRNAYARYERGTAMPSVTKLSELIQAVSPGGDLVLAESQGRYADRHQPGVRTDHP